jgi:hypothetical protein
METKARRGPSDFIPMAILAALAILVLAMIVTWLLAAHYSLPDDDTITLGLLGAVIVLLAALVLLVFLAGSKLLEGRLKAAALQGSAILGLGLLIASLVGVLPWSLRWVDRSYPWVSGVSMLIVALGALVSGFLSWRSRAARQSGLPPPSPIYPTVLLFLLPGAHPSFRILLAPLVLADLIGKAVVFWKMRRAGTSTAGPA